MILHKVYLKMMKMAIKKRKKISKNITSTNVWLRIQKLINFVILKRVVLFVR